MGSRMAMEDGTGASRPAGEAGDPSAPSGDALVDVVNDGVFVHDAETGAILDANRRAEAMYGYTRAELRGVNIDALSEGKPPYTAAAALALIHRVAAGEPQLFEWRARRRSGELFWVEVNLSRVRLGETDRLVAVVRDVTERKRAEEALQESEELARRQSDELRAALADLERSEAERLLAVDVLERGDAVLVLDREFRIVLMNENEERLGRRSRSECLGRNVWEVFPEGASKETRFRAAFERVMRERTPESFEEYYAPLEVWTSVSVYPTRHGGIAAFIRDVTEGKRAEEALREQEAFASRILASSLNGIYVMDLGAGAVYVNARYTQLTGYGLDDLRALGPDLVTALFHPEDRDRMRAHLGALVRAADGEVLDLEYRFRARDGHWMTCFSRETPFARGPDGRVRQLIGTFVDVTELRRAETTARESEARYQTLFEAMSEAFAVFEIVVDPQGAPSDARFLEVNPAFERLTGLTRADVAGRLLSEVAPKESAFWVGAYVEIEATGTPVRVEHRSTVVHRDYEVYGFSPRPRQLALLFVDVTDRKRVEQELRDADRRKNEFLGVLSHELRNPLAPIRNSLYVLTNAAAASEPAVRARQVLLRQTEQLTRLVDDLLDVTRISRGKISLRRTRVEAGELLRSVCDDHRSLFERSGVDLRLETPDEPAWLDADPTRLSQIVGNLLQNAAKFTLAGGWVEVTATPRAGELELRVRDSGVGMDPAEIPRMFEAFAQAERGRPRGAAGLGLGLALVKGLVELHGGTVTARSAGVGQGSEVVVTLPLAAARTPEAPAPATAAATANPRARSVLVVDDNPDAARSLADVLEVSGHHVRIASDGRTAIELAHHLRPDVVICDIGLPDMTGYDVARALRLDEALRSTRLIALTGYAQPEHRERALETGFDAHLAKPAALDALDALIAG
jgi:PAS domain S-box-containing protein